ncbi:laccase [Penicillium canescens]|uniref:Laccase n=1 Tax=Penicillium canescens TaxID=5083 RepID=A0AAD6I049_PENCN|nr:laccase [Penicillium canescens]KAJ6023624.1 laccase [Penicillium canescens]KAJ6042922.1 laccase [Penicillium canescens]KAJ6077039.1 laccase [Penicillium canescens]KAJ6159351.1 laccase [Penicillium canescens]
MLQSHRTQKQSPCAVLQEQSLQTARQDSVQPAKHLAERKDGVVTITQCPIAPYKTITTSGGLFNTVIIGLQAWEGLFGGIVINGPAMIILNDWDYNTVDQLFMTVQKYAPPTLATAVINGTNVFGTDGTVNQTGTRFNASFTAETSY